MGYSGMESAVNKEMLMVIVKPSWLTRDHIAWVVLAAALAFSVFFRCRLVEFPLERDEGEYAYSGQLILQGIPVYSKAYNMKLPGTYLAYAGLMAVFGQTTAGIHLGLLAVGLATICLIFFFTRKMFDPLTGAVAALAFSIMSTSWSVLGMAAHATHFMAFFGIAGVWVLWLAIGSDKTWLYFASGVLLGLAFLMKQQGIFLPVFGALAVLLSFRRRQVFFSRSHIAVCLLYAAGAMLPFACVCLWMQLVGLFDKFWFWTVQYAWEYVNQLPINVVVQLFWRNMKGIIETNWPLFLLSIAGAARLAFSKGMQGRRAFILGWTGFSFLCVCPGFYFRQHYFIVLLPCVSILSGVGFTALLNSAVRIGNAESFSPITQKVFSAIWRKQVTNHIAMQSSSRRVLARRLFVGLTTLVLIAAVAYPVGAQCSYYFIWSPRKACREIYGSNPFIEIPIIADYIKNNSGPDDRIAVLGSEPEIFFYAGRLSATGYLYTYALMEEHPFVRRMQDQMIAEVDEAKPRFLVLVNVPTSWLRRANSDSHIFDWMQSYTATGYDLVGMADLVSKDQTDYKWDSEAAGATPQSRYYLLVFRRKQREQTVPPDRIAP